MPKRSAGLLMYRKAHGTLEVFLVHPGGPYWAKKDEGAWSIPKGEYDDGEEDAFRAAKREFEEEVGVKLDGNFIPLGEIVQKSGKRVVAWAIEGDLDPRTLVSNTTQIEWPPRSGKTIEIPEVDRGAFFTVEEAKKKINPAQIPFLEKLDGLKG